ncbi:MAG: hypothetical protein RRC34_11995 [Lentisphaeria bacterium]|nr:hypothetical protein [Lentisphaeria bacterium]
MTTKRQLSIIAYAGLLLAVLATAVAQPAATPHAPVPEIDITALREDFAAAVGENTSSVARRRKLKNIVRDGQALLQASPDASNRYVLLNLMFQSQKRLLAIENTERNRTVFFDLSGQLAQAPDDYADLRLEADLMLSEKELSEDNATLEERAEALGKLMDRYRGTPGEAKSLLMGALIVQKLEAPELEDAIYDALDEGFSDDSEVIDFRRKFLKIGRLDVTFAGEFALTDGRALKFPMDTAGHLCLMVFWSKNKPGFDTCLDTWKEELARYPGLLDVFSFNLDELPDGGESILREHGLDWTVIKLPGGRQHQAYRTYAQGDPTAVLVNEYGMAVIRPEIVHGRLPAIDEGRISEPRYMAQLQSLFIGDFMVHALTIERPVSKEWLEAIQGCFPLAPFRYRLTREEALENYRKAEKLCAEAIEANPEAEHLWVLRNHRMIARLGIWSMDFDPGALNRAVEEARLALATDLPPEAEVIPRFCLAKAAIRDSDTEADRESVVTAFLKDCGGDTAPPSALAAASILALDARSRDLHETYRNLFLEKHGENPEFYAFAAFLRDRHHRFRILTPNHNRRERGTRGYIVAHGYEPMTDRLPSIQLKSLDGATLSLPEENNDRLTYLLFVEPPADPEADFPVVLDRNGKPTTNDPIRQVMKYAHDLAGQHVNKGIDVIAAFLCDDAGRVGSLMKKNGWTCQAALVPGGLGNPMVRQLGILSADRLPNVFVIRRNGTIAWRGSGLPYKTEFGFPFAYLLAMKANVEVCDVEYAYKALEKGDFKEASQLFSGPFPLALPDRYGWLAPRYHGQAVAYMGLMDWPAALEAIDKAIDAHKLRHFRGRRSKNLEDWRKDADAVILKKPCDTIADLWKTKAMILEKLGRGEEAAEWENLARQPLEPDYPSIYGAFHEKLTSFGLPH